MNNINLFGRLVKDPEPRTVGDNTVVVNFTLAVNRNYKNEKGEVEADFINVVAWNKTAEIVSMYVKKGHRLGVTGRLQVRSYDDEDGNRKWVTDVVAEKIYLMETKKEAEASEESEDIEFKIDVEE